MDANTIPPIEAVCAELLTPQLFRCWLTTERAAYADIPHMPWTWAAWWIDKTLGHTLFLAVQQAAIVFASDVPPARRLAIPHWLAVYTGLPYPTLPKDQPDLDRTGAIERLDAIMASMPSGEDDDGTP